MCTSIQVMAGYSVRFAVFFGLVVTWSTTLGVKRPFQPAPPQQRGIALGLYSEDPNWSYVDMLSEIKEVGANYVSIVVPWYIKTTTDTVVYKHPRFTVPMRTVERTIMDARAAGLKVFLFPILRVEDKSNGGWRGTLAPRNKDAFYKSYTEVILRFAGLAERLNIPLLSVGSELSSLSLHSDQTFDTFSLREKELDTNQLASLHQAFTFASNYAKNPEDWLLLTGGYGCGKTHLAAAIANDRVSQGQQALFVVVPDLLDHLRATYAPNSPVPYDRRLYEIRSAPLLILDDLGTHSATPWAQEKLYQIFNHRYNARLPTVITATDDAKIDDRLKSRLLDRGRCTNLRIDAPSYRGAVARTRRRTASRQR